MASTSSNKPRNTVIETELENVDSSEKTETFVNSVPKIDQSCFRRKGPIHEMEKLLVVWIEKQVQKLVPLTFLNIQAKASSIFEEIKPKFGIDCDVAFIPSPAWFRHFKTRANLHSLILIKDTSNVYQIQAPTVDVKLCEPYKKSLQRVINIEKYLPEQIFNVDKTSLFWKKLPETTYIKDETQLRPKLKSCEDQVTLLLGGNAVGYKLKPLLVYHSENPKAFKGICKATLPVHYRTNVNCQITREIFDEWFMNCFIPEVRTYCLNMNLPFKILLLLDGPSGYPQYLNDLHPDIRVGSIPPEIISIVQPMNQGPKSILKANYLRYIFDKALSASEICSQTLRGFWEDYNILDAIANIYAAWEDISDNCMKGIWKNALYPSFLNSSEEFNKYKYLEEIFKKIVQLGLELNLYLTVDNVVQLIEEVGGELTCEHVEVIQEDAAEEDGGVCDKVFILNDLTVAFRKIRDGMDILKSMNPSSRRFKRVEKLVDRALTDYKDLYHAKEKQTAVMSKKVPR